MKYLALVLLALLASCSKSDAYLKARVVKLVQGKSMCSGEQVHAPSGVDYILTAGHCDLLAKNGVFTVQTEDGRTLLRKFIAEDPNSDLLILEGIPGMRGLDIAKSTYRGEWIRTFTHGLDKETYETRGVLIQEEEMITPIPPYDNECKAPKYTEFVLDFGFSKVPVCLLKVQEMASTAFIAPGSSGGEVVNRHGELVGVASATGGDGFYFFVRLKDIQDFIRNY